MLHTAGPDSPERPRGPGGPMGPGCPLVPSLPAGPAGPGGPYRTRGWKAVSLSELGLFFSKCKTLLFLQIHSEVWIRESDKGNQMHQQFLSITLRPFALLCMKNICMVTFPFIFLIMLSAKLIKNRDWSPFRISVGVGFTNHSPPCLSATFPHRE